MNDVRIYAGTLEASKTDRTAVALLVPFGEDCSSNLGRFSVDSGVFTIPADLTGVSLNVEHKRENVAGAVTKLEETPTGIVAHFTYAETPNGDRALADARSGKRSKVSAEVADVVIRAGKAVAGLIFGAAQVKEGAFPSATLLAAAVDTPNEPDPNAPADPLTTEEHSTEELVDENGDKITRAVDVVTVTEGNKTTTTTTVVEETEPAPPADNQEDAVGNAAAPTTLTAGRAGRSTGSSSPNLEAPAGMSFVDVMRALNEIKSGRASSTLLASLLEEGGPGAATLFATLSDIKYSGSGNLPAKAINPFPQWIGQLWDGLAFVRDVVECLGHDDLTAATIAGWTWGVRPEGATWAGNKSAVSSNTPTALPYSVVADYFAGAHDHANEYRHFSNPEYWESYYKAMRESYAKWSNDRALESVLTAATEVEGDTVPADLAVGLSLLVDGAVEVVSGNALPSFAIIEPALYKGILKTTNHNVLGYLDAALGFKAGTMAGEGFRLLSKASYKDLSGDVVEVTGVTVGAKEAATFHELGEVPLRIEAEDLVKGGLDTGLFGYAGTVIHKDDALVHVTEPVAP